MGDYMDTKDYYKNEIIKMINQINNMSVLEWLYHFIQDGITHRWN